MSKRVMVVSICALLCQTLFATITNIAQCLNLELTAERLSQFPFRDNSTPQNSLLGFVRGSITGDYLSFLTPLSDSARVDEAGVSDLSQVTQYMTDRFYTFVVASGFSNHVVCAHSEVTSNDTIVLKTSIHSRRGLMNKTNEVQTIMRQIGGSWRIVNWDVSE